ncbi:MAG: Glu-tRNA(Gln) amidotransferase subunit GatD [archaeon]
MSEKISPGDKIRVTYDNETIVGILMPTPTLSENDNLIIKLENGYNMGIARPRVKKTEIVEKYNKLEIEKKEVLLNKNLPTVTILSTGGTISSKVDYRTGGVYADYTAEDIVALCPELNNIANIRAKKVLSLMSEDMLPTDWINITKIIENEIKKGTDGIVLTQGTDTMHFTAAALSFFFDEINIPIIITGSQRSIDRGASDAYINLICSVNAAAHFDGAEVMTCMHGSTDDNYCLLIRGTKVRKMHTSRRDAFRPINDIAIAKIFPDNRIEKISRKYTPANRTKRNIVKTTASFEDKTALHYVYPGMDPDVIDYYIKKGIKGIVIAATALGHVNTCTEKSLIPFVKKAVDRNIAVFISSQTLYGKVNPYVYTNLRKLSIEAKAVYLEDMHPETAYIKLGWVLSQTKEYEKIKEMMLTNYKGEFNETITSDMFLN